MSTTHPVPNTDATPALTALELWLAEKADVAGQSERSCSSHREHVTDTLDLIANQLGVPTEQVPLEALTRDHLVLTLQAYRNRPDRRYNNPDAAPRRRADTSIRRRLSALRTFLGWCVATGRLDTNPADDLDVPSPGKRLPKALAVDAAEQLLEACESSFWPERDRLLIWLGLGAGLRLSEATTSRTDRLGAGNPPKTLAVSGKGGKDRVVPLLPPLQQALADYLPTRCEMLEHWDTDSPWLLLSRRPHELTGVTNLDGTTPSSLQLTASGASKRVAALLKNAGLKRDGVRMHALRHTFATLALRSGAYGIRELQEQLGHADLATIQMYTEVTEQDLLRAAAAHPLSNLPSHHTAGG